MSPYKPSMARRDRRRETTGALAVSILVHIALLIVLAHQVAPGLRAPEPIEPDVQVQLTAQPPPPAATPPAERPRVSRRPRRQTAAVAPRPTPLPRPPPRPAGRAIQPTRPAAPPHAAPAPRLTPSSATANTPATGATAGSTAAGGGSAGGRWSVQGEDGQDGVRRFLRATVGCSHEDYVGLTEPERASCDRRVGRDARALGIPPDKIAGFIAAAQAQEEARAGRTGPLPNVFTPCKGVGSNLDRGCLNVKAKRSDDGP